MNFKFDHTYFISSKYQVQVCDFAGYIYQGNFNSKESVYVK